MSTAEDDYCPHVREAAYQGAPGAFSEDAALTLVGTGAGLLPCRTLDEVFRAVIEARARFGIVPIENTIAGAVPGVADLMQRYEVRVADRVTLRIAQALVGIPGTRIEWLQRVSSHPVALAQCTRFFQRHPRVKPIADFDTAGSIANMVCRADPTHGAIGSARAAEVWGAVVLKREIQDRLDNQTTFALVTTGTTGNDR